MNQENNYSEKTYWLAFDKLKGIGLGHKRIQILYEYFQSLKTAWTSDILDLKMVAGLPESVINQFVQIRPTISIEEGLANLEKYKIKAFTQLEPEYPHQFKQLSQSPLIIYFKGEFDASWFDKAIGIVGTRTASDYALKQTEIISTDLAQSGFTIISGLAMGIDSSAHKGALKVQNGRTVAVLANGVEQIVPLSSKSIYQLIEQRGLILSEYPPQTLPEKGYFPARNRLVAALSKGILVSEADIKSGALITAERALELNKPIFGLTGLAGDNKGVHQWIRKGKAKLISSAEDILEELNIFAPIQNSLLDEQLGEIKSKKIKQNNIVKQNIQIPTITNLPLPELTPEEEKVFSQLYKGQFTGIDELIERVNLPVHKVNSVLLTLQLKKLIQRNTIGAISLA